MHTEVGTVVLRGPQHELMKAVVGVSDPREVGSEHGCVHNEVGTVVLGGPGHELMRAVVGVSDPRGVGSEHGCVHIEVGIVVEIKVIACLGGLGMS